MSRNLIRWLAATLAVVAGAAAVLRDRFVAVKVDGRSMEPTLRPGDWVLVRRVRPDSVRRGQIVVLAHPGDISPESGNPPWLIKRVVAVPGDSVPRASVPALRDTTEQHVPSGSLVILGDNAAASFDSRRAGYFAADTLLGIVVRRLANPPRRN